MYVQRKPVLTMPTSNSVFKLIFSILTVHCAPDPISPSTPLCPASFPPLANRTWQSSSVPTQAHSWEAWDTELTAHFSIKHFTNFTYRGLILNSNWNVPASMHSTNKLRKCKWLTMLLFIRNKTLEILYQPRRHFFFFFYCCSNSTLHTCCGCRTGLFMTCDQF